MFDIFIHYEAGLEKMAKEIDKSQVHQFSVLSTRLKENISLSRLYSDTETRRSERAMILDALNRMALSILNIDFLSLCGTETHSRIVNHKKSEIHTDTIKILFLGANPLTTSRLNLAEEVKRIQNNLKLSKERDRLELVQEWAVTPDTLMQVVLDESPEIIHFSGHGEEDGIVLQDEAGKPKAVTGDALEALFELFKDSIRCVVLNSCYSKIQAEVIRKQIPYVVGMKASIPDEAAIAFSVGFYKAIGAGKDIPFAFKLGLASMSLDGSMGKNIPVLL